MQSYKHDFHERGILCTAGPVASGTSLSNTTSCARAAWSSFSRWSRTRARCSSGAPCEIPQSHVTSSIYHRMCAQVTSCILHTHCVELWVATNWTSSTLSLWLHVGSYFQTRIAMVEWLMMRLQLCSYVIFTAVVVLSERVEATVQKGFFRFMGTVIGGRECLTVLQHALRHA